MEIAFSLGSNIGDRASNLRVAKERMSAFADTRLTASSKLYETSPVDVPDEWAHLPFINAVLVVHTEATPQQWLERVQSIEADLGRMRDPSDRNAPRPIDIDLLYADDAHFDGKDLTLPHPRWADRRFVVEPLAEVRPDHVLPGSDRTVSEHLGTLSIDDTCDPLEEAW